MDANGEALPTISLVTAQPPVCTEGIIDYLRNHGYSLSEITSDDEQRDVLNGPYPDIIMGLGDADSLSVFRTLHDEAVNSTRPVLVLITDNYQGILPLDWADLVLPPNPDYIDYQLRTVLRLRAENAALAHSNQALHDEIEEVRRQFIDLQRDSHHVEVLKNAIVHTVAHELNTPLLQVKSAVYLLAESARERREESVAAQLATDATARLESIIKNITRLSKAMDPNLGPVMLRHTFAAAHRSLSRAWETGGQLDRVQVDIPEDLPHIYADNEGLTIVLELLLDNAIKFSKDNAGSPVELKAIHDNDEVEISVRDYGIGIPKDKWDMIFETFYQVDSSTTRKYGGAGVGLAIVRLILERHNTKVRVASKPGEGSTFSFKLQIYQID